MITQMAGHFLQNRGLRKKFGSVTKFWQQIPGLLELLHRQRPVIGH